MPNFSPRLRAVPYAVAVLAVALGLLVRWPLWQLLGNSVPYMTLFPAVMVAAYLGGLWPGLLATALGAAGAVYFLVEPHGSFWVATPGGAAGLGLFLFVGVVISALCESLRRTERRHAATVRQTREGEERLRVTLTSIGDAVIVTDPRGLVTFMNPVAESLTGWGSAEAAGQPLERVFPIVNEETRKPVENPVTKVLRDGVVIGLGNHTVLVARGGREVPIDDSGAPIRGADGSLAGVVLVFRDVTEARRAAEARARLAAIVESSDDAIISKTLDGIIRSWNRGAERLYGYSAAEMIGKPLAILVPPDHPDELPAIMERLKRGERIEHFETVRVRKDGTRVDVSLKISPVRDAEGKIAGASKIARDITAQKRAEEALRAVAARTAAILRTALDAIITMDAAGIVVEFNPAAEKMFGFTRGEAVGRPLAELIIPPSLRDQHTRGLARYLATGEGPVLNRRIEMTALRADGTEFPVELAVTRISDEGPPFFTASIRDITDRKRAEESMRFLLDASATLVPLVDYESALQRVARLAVPHFADWCAVDVLAADGSLRRLAVAHVDPARVELAHDLNRRYPPDPADPTGVWNVLRTAKSELLAEIPDSLIEATVREEGLRRALRELGLRSYMAVPLVVRGEAFGVVTFVTAESGRRYGPDDLRLAEDFARRAATAVENARLYAELKDADRRKDEFLALLGHELRNPLAPIRNAVRLLELKGDDPAVVARSRAIVDRQATQLTRLVEELLDASRIARGKVRLTVERLDLAGLARTAAEDHRAEADEAGLAVEVVTPPGPVWVRGDPARLAQVASNLLNNAVKFTPAGGRVGVRVAEEGGDAVLAVADTGVGIAPTALPTLFQPFRQVDADPARTQGGLGLGLAVVKGLVELHGGRAEAASAGPGAGATFTVRLPLAPPAESAPAGPAPAPPAARATPASGGRRVVVIEDGVDTAESLRDLLELKGFAVGVAYNGPDGLAAVRRERPDAVVCDIGLPGMTGYEVARALRADPTTAGAVLVAVSGYAQDEDRRKAREAGFDALLAKPADADELVRLLARAG